MLTPDQYAQLLPHREDIIKFQRTKKLTNTGVLPIANVIFQRLGMGSINFSCDGCKINAMNDLHSLIINYEEAQK